MPDYAFIVDAALSEPKYRAELTRIETRLSALGLRGRWERMTILKNIVDTTTEAIKRGAKTIVVVGQDQTVTKLLPVILEHNVTLGLIPVGPDQFIAAALGISDGVAACDCLSRRIIMHLDVGRANRQYFLLQLAAPAPTNVTCDGAYTVSSLDPRGSLAITNLGVHGQHGQPADGRLELVVQPAARGNWWSRGRDPRLSVFPITRAKIEGRSEATSLLDGHLILKPPITVEVVPGKLAVIVGPRRKFS